MNEQAKRNKEFKETLISMASRIFTPEQSDELESKLRDIFLNNSLPLTEQTLEVALVSINLVEGYRKAAELSLKSPLGKPSEELRLGILGALSNMRRKKKEAVEKVI